MKVSELIEHLNQFPQGATVVIYDADTGWALDQISVEIRRTEDSEELLCVIDGGGYSANDRGYVL